MICPDDAAVLGSSRGFYNIMRTAEPLVALDPKGLAALGPGEFVIIQIYF